MNREWVFLFLSLLWLKGEKSAFLQGAEAPIILMPDQIIVLSGSRQATEWFDEPHRVGDPRMGQGGTPVTAFHLGWQNRDLYYPLEVVIDLGGSTRLSTLAYFDAEGDGGFSISGGRPDSWEHWVNDDLKAYLQWKVHPLDRETRYLKFTMETPAAAIREVVLYGEPSGQSKPQPSFKNRPERVPMERFLGINAFVDDPVDRIAAVGTLREYHTWGWDEGNQDSTYEGFPNNRYAWSPSWVSGPGWGWDFDDFYTRLKAAGVEVVPVVQQTAPYLVGHDFGRVSSKPVSAGEDPEDPFSYREHADYLFQFAARYGQTKVPDERLKLREGQPRRSGLDLVHYLENWNEADNWWSGRAAHFKPFELAAMASADYDGHQGRMGTTVGVKHADPRMKLVLSGLARPEVEYLKAVRLWAQIYREGSFPADVINLHHYSNDAGGQLSQAKHGISPEEDHLKERMTACVRWRDEFLPDQELWVTEFGYDLHPNSRQHAPAIGTQDAQEVQGQWLVRSYLELAAAGVDRACQYMLRDVDAASGTQYQTSGLTGEKARKHPPKKSWFYVATLKEVLRGTTFREEMAPPTSEARAYRFENAEGTRKVVALWLATSRDQRLKGVEFPVPDAHRASWVSLEPGEARGLLNHLDVREGRVMLDLSERPGFLVLY